MRSATLLLLMGACLQAETGAVATERAAQLWWAGFQDPDLNSLVERAVRANIDLKLAASRLREVRAGMRLAGARGLPSIGAAETQQRVRGGLPQGFAQSGSTGHTSLLAPFETNFFQQGFDASWEIDLFGGKRHAVNAAAAEVTAAEQSERETLSSLLAEVARVYGEIRAGQRRLEIAKHVVRLEADVLTLAKVRSEAGLGTELDVERQASHLAAAEAEIAVCEAAVSTSLHRLAVLLGEKPGALDRELTNGRPLPVSTIDMTAGVPSDLLKRRPDVRRADAEVTAACARVGVARSDFFPKLTLTAFQHSGIRSLEFT